MARLSGVSVAVVGSGVFGLTAALVLARRGARVTLHDPAPLGDNASGVAAGMLAPAFESGLDPASAGHFPLLLRARDRWPDLLGSLGLAPASLARDGGLFIGDAAAAAALSARLTAAGAQIERLDRGQALELSPGMALGDADEVLFAPQDWRLEPIPLLRAFHAAFRQAGGQVRGDRVRVVDGRLATADGAGLAADVVVLAAGAEAAGMAAIAPELSLLQPVKGQILHFSGGPSAGPVLRTARGYLTPQPGGPAAGATMEPGLSDRTTDPAALAGLRAEAERLFPSLAGTPARGMAGIRAATPDGLPLVGRSAGGKKVLLCVGARRNGWLLAPLAAELLAATLAGEAAGPDERLLDPTRFAKS